MNQDRSAIGGSSTGSGNGNMHYNTSPSQISSAVKDGSQFILLVKDRQSSEYQVWSSGDPTQTRDLFTQAQRQVDQLTPA